MRLIYNYYLCDNNSRQNEIDICFEKNLSLFDDIKIIVSDIDLYSDKFINVHYRPSFDVFFEYCKKDDWNVVCNSDIFLGETIFETLRYDKNTFFCLTRYDLINGFPTLLNRPDSQDTWVFYGKPRFKAPFFMGVPGCDNHLAYLAEQAGYNVINPSKKIKTYHLHESNERSYNRSSNKVRGGYKTIYPHD